MESVILVIHLMLALAIIVLVLIQPSESGDGLTGGGGGINAGVAPRRSGNALTRATAILATGFFITSLSLAIIAGNKPVSKSILDAMETDTTAATTEVEKAVEATADKAEDVAKDAEDAMPKAPAQ